VGASHVHVEQVTSRRARLPPPHLLNQKKNIGWLNEGLLSLLYHTMFFFAVQGCGGGGSVRRRNALHEVGGRVPEVPRVRNARAGSETHTHLNIFTHLS
jgi:hypothetical protein